MKLRNRLKSLFWNVLRIILTPLQEFVHVKGRVIVPSRSVGEDNSDIEVYIVLVAAVNLF